LGLPPDLPASIPSPEDYRNGLDYYGKAMTDVMPARTHVPMPEKEIKNHAWQNPFGLFVYTTGEREVP
jgi:hypothetical protein